MTDIVRTDGVLGGEPRLGEHRIAVLQVADVVLEAGHRPEYVADRLDVSLAGGHSALAYYEHPDEVDATRERHDRLEDELAERTATPDHAE